MTDTSDPPGTKKQFEIEYLHSVIKNDLPKLSKEMRDVVRKAIQEKLTSDVGKDKAVRVQVQSEKRLHIGDYIVNYRIDTDRNVVVITFIKHVDDR